MEDIIAKGCTCVCEGVGKATDLVAQLPDDEPSGLKKGIEIAIIVLMVLLVILGLIIGFKKMEDKDNDCEEPNDHSYY